MALPSWLSFPDLPRTHGDVLMRGRLRVTPRDFLVDEISGIEPDGDGEHALLRVRKIGANTEWVARRLAAHAGLPVSKVSYAGLKDRNAVTTQWFSLHLGSRADPRWEELGVEAVEILEAHRHRRKLRRGALRANRFLIRVHDIQGDPESFDRCLARVRAVGVPNYFGPQRFGHADGNLQGANALFNGQAGRVKRHVRGLWLSAARSQLFNELLTLRVTRRDWDSPLEGDCMQLAGSRSHFSAQVVDEELRARTRAFDIHPTGPLWGAGDAPVSGVPEELEQAVAGRFEGWVDGLARAGLRQERRALRLRLDDLSAGWDDGALVLGFELPAGAYATTLLRELLDWTENAP